MAGGKHDARYPGKGGIMCRLASLFLALVTNSFLFTAASAQAPLSRGDRVRVWHSSTCCKRPLVGMLDTASHDSVILRMSRGSPAVGISRNAITSIERGRRDGSHAREGAVVGLVAGAAAGFAASHISPSHCQPGYECIGRKFSLTFDPIIGGVLGMLIGAVVGAHHPYERWEPAALPDRVGARITPSIQYVDHRAELRLAHSL
jgi:hypothetical protein